MKTTLYNHIKLGKDDKPLIPNVMFKSIIVLLNWGFIEEAEYAYNNYSLTVFQKSLYEYTKQKANLSVKKE